MILGLDFVFVTSSIGAPSSIDPISVPGFIPYLQDRQHINMHQLWSMDLAVDCSSSWDLPKLLNIRPYA